METVEIIEILNRGEDSRNQFKSMIHNEEQLAAEMVALSNGSGMGGRSGGCIFIGVGDDGSIIGLSESDIGKLNQTISNAASQHIRPPINPETQNTSIDGKTIVVLSIPAGSGPYQDKNGVYWMKCGADKRKAASREALQRMFQESGLVHADTTPVRGMTITDIDMPNFRAFFQKRYGEELESQTLPLEQIIKNMNLGNADALNIAGALLFARDPSILLPAFIVKAMAYPGKSASTDYRDSRNITGKISDIFRQSIGFILSNIRQIQGEQGINSIGEPEIQKIVLEELLVNALVHRDYFVSASVRIFIFSDRVEIISPGHLPNELSIDNIKLGVSNYRNPVLASYANHILPYRGVGTGIRRALKNCPSLGLIDDREGNEFKCIITRKEL